ncbi:unnamed protein product [Linum trigynum]|uniref:Secreted protein n=1 Tax=Linum trigynum TaxID=586398 RepID=A0AAV2CBI1_9ROSI
MVAAWLLLPDEGGAAAACWNVDDGGGGGATRVEAAGLLPGCCWWRVDESKSTRVVLWLVEGSRGDEMRGNEGGLAPLREKGEGGS